MHICAVTGIEFWKNKNRPHGPVAHPAIGKKYILIGP